MRPDAILQKIKKRRRIPEYAAASLDMVTPERRAMLLLYRKAI